MKKDQIQTSKMSQRARASRQREHAHCASCFSGRCRAPGSCALAPCRLLCGAAFHLCKEDEHLLLCPNVRVPCLNAAYGCPAHLPRASRAAHLRACPASVVSCSMEWLRWPLDDTSPHCCRDLQENVLRGDPGHPEALDVALALVDQSELYGRLKMKPLYPELMEEEEEEEEEEEKEEETKEEEVKEECCGATYSDAIKAAMERSSGQPEEAQQNSGAEPRPVINRDTHSLFEMMFSMDRGGCTVAQQNLDKAKEAAEKDPKAQREEGSGREGADRGRDLPGGVPADTGKTGQAPWVEGVLERLGEELTPQEFNMYLVHHGRMLLAFGQIQACTPRERDFVYGSMEPIPVQTLRSFKVPDSYHYRQRVHLYDTAARAPSEPRGVDTSDLDASEDDWYGDEAAATLLGYAEREVMGHKISESKGADGLYVDLGTQTHSFRSAPFRRGSTLAEVTAERPPKLRLQLQTESVSSRHSRAGCAFSFICGHAFHRREFSSHVRNVHSEIHTALNGWFEQRCPLAYLGCTYSQRRFQPSTHKATVTYNQQLRSFNLRPTLAEAPEETEGRADEGRRASLSSLPYEVLCHVASFLDSLSLSQLALVSRLLRQVCSSQLQDRGMVTLRWERDTHSQGGARWKAKPVWEFSRLFSPVDSWHMSDAPPMSAHLKVCPFYERHSWESGRVPLPSMSQGQRCSQERVSLVHSLTGNRWEQ